MRKQRSGGKGYDLRWFVLKEKSLEYFDRPGVTFADCHLPLPFPLPSPFSSISLRPSKCHSSPPPFSYKSCFFHFRFLSHLLSLSPSLSLSLSKQSKKPKGTIQIGLTTSIEPPRVVHEKQPPNLFYIAEPKKITAVVAETKEIMAAWMTILRQACSGGVTKRSVSLSLSLSLSLSPHRLVVFYLPVLGIAGEFCCG